ncbi:substrate-binding periplasmic protein [Vibrio sp. SCSIO 43137]|uniref:substrate-binding periplasmic protein n=1 Tax=Vibrio sp. SCSIO 43137 TaxID=3021011 RepID=UPI0023070F32|nr:transporter substrate-binding domain-containing protein [Vibrio sp. SCSIO 43137]WCE30059.1 transporter substrate-binding domain-containing protein [Vibrio sp. SCSIO 43137]
MRTIFLSSIWAILLLFCSISYAEEANNKQEILVVKGDGSWAPLEIYKNGKFHGFHIDLVKAVAKRLDVTVKFKSYPWKRAVEMVRRGKADAITFMSYTDERAEFGLFYPSNILSHSHIGLFTLKENAEKYSFNGDLKQLEGIKIGTIKGFVYEKSFDQAEFLTKDRSSTHETQLILKIIHKRLPMGIGNIEDIKYVARQISVLDQLEFITPLIISDQENYIVFSKKRDKGFAQQFASEMAAFKKTADYQKLCELYTSIRTCVAN